MNDGGEFHAGARTSYYRGGDCICTERGGSFIEFNNRFVNALVDTVLFAVVFGALVSMGKLTMAFIG